MSMSALPPPGTITGASGATSVAPGAEFIPTSASGDGTLHVDGELAGFVYAQASFPHGSSPIWSFTALDGAHQPLSTHPTQRAALRELIDRARS